MQSYESSVRTEWICVYVYIYIYIYTYRYEQAYSQTNKREFIVFSRAKESYESTLIFAYLWGIIYVISLFTLMI